MDLTDCPSVKQDFLNIECRRGWQPLFMEIREQSANFSTTDAKKIENRDLNRYRDVNPFDHSRVNVTRGNCSYINASLVKVEAVERSYILTQGPLPSTVSQFWAMVWEQSCKAIVMLNNVIERNQIKCHTYWPVGSPGGRILTLEDVRLTVELMEEDHHRNYILRTFKMVDLDNHDSNTVYQYHYTTWPDFGVPAAPSDFLQFLMHIRKTGALGPGTAEEPVGPAVIHCSAGIGRSGTFCIVDTALLLLERGGPVNVKDLVLEMRRYRMGLIQTAEQLRFSYLAIMEGAEPPPTNGAGIGVSGSEDESLSEESSSCDGSSSSGAEEVEEEDDVHCAAAPPMATESQFKTLISTSAQSRAPDADDVPPPIPPRSESLASAGAGADYDQPLPAVPVRMKRTHPQMEQQAAAAAATAAATGSESASASDDNPEEESDAAAAGANEEAADSGAELEPKRRKGEEAPVEETIPRTAAAFENESGLRQRPVASASASASHQRREDRLERTQQLIASIKEKQKAAEERTVGQDRLRLTTKWMGIGVGLIVLVFAGVRYFQT